MTLFKPSCLAAAVLAAALAGCASHDHKAPAAQGGHMSGQMGDHMAAQAGVLREAVAPALYELAYAAGTDTVYVSSAGGFGDDAPASQLLQLDGKTLAVKSATPLSRRGFGLAFDEAAGRVYVGNTLDASVLVLDAASGKQIGMVQLTGKVKGTDRQGKPAQMYPHKFRELVLDKANHRLFLPGMGTAKPLESALYVVNTRTLKVEKVIKGLGYAAIGITQDARAGKIYAANMQGQLFTVNARTLAVEKTQNIAVDQPLNLAFDAKRGQVLAVDEGMPMFDEARKKAGLSSYAKHGDGNRVVAIDPANGQVVASMPTGKNPIALLVDAQRDRLYVSTREGASVDVFDLNTRQQLRSFSLPQHPNSLTLDEKTGAVYVSVKNGRDAAKGSKESVVRLSF